MERRPDVTPRSPQETPDIPRTVAELNALRRAADPAARTAADRLAEALFGASNHLIAYGSLVPGGSNEAQLRGLHGSWRPGWVTGTLAEAGWGAAAGYPALRWSPNIGARVPAQVFTSPELADHWPRLDAFEGEKYRRILAPIYDDDGLLEIGYLYEIVEGSPTGG